MHRIARFLQDHAVGALLIILVVGLSLATPLFLRAINLSNVLEQASLIGIIAMGAGILLISGNFDLSVGGQCAFVGVVTASAVNDLGPTTGVAIGIALGLTIGAVNGLIVVVLGINSLMATLGTAAVLTGAALLFTSSAPVIVSGGELNDLVTARFLGLSAPVWIFAVMAVIAAWYLHLTVGGRETFAVGANFEAARYAGVRVGLVRFIPYLATGVFTAVAAVILVVQVNAGLPDAGLAWPLQVVTAIVLGGISIYGGRGTILMGVIGVLIVTVANNGFNLLGLPNAWQQVFTGALLIIAVGVDRFTRAQRSRREREALVRGSAQTNDASA